MNKQEFNKGYDKMDQFALAVIASQAWHENGYEKEDAANKIWDLTEAILIERQNRRKKFKKYYGLENED